MAVQPVTHLAQKWVRDVVMLKVQALTYIMGYILQQKGKSPFGETSILYSSERIHCHVQLGNHIRFWPEHQHHRFVETTTSFIVWGFSSAHSRRLWRWTTPPLCTLPYQSTIHDTTFVQQPSSELEANCCPLAVALVQVADKMHTAPPYTGRVFIPSDTLKYAELLCYWKQLYETFTHRSIHSKMCLLPLATHNSVIVCHHIWQIRKCYQSFFTPLVVFVLLWRDDIIKNFLFMYHQQEPLRNSLKKQEVCVW